MDNVLFSKKSAVTELSAISEWWLKNTLDHQHGGFVGQVDFWGNIVEGERKGIVQNSRILWFYSESAMFSGKDDDKNAADRAFEYLISYFDDIENGGAFWEVSSTGELVNGKKQTYGQSFCIYAFCAYYRLTGNKLAVEKSMEYFELIEKYARDKKCGGYVEAYTQTWQPIDDFRLSDKDLNAPKSMNTHLHVLEAYSALYAVKPEAKIKEALAHVIDVFNDFIIDKSTNHLKLFFDMQWQDISKTVSYGHDIEASWLLWEAVEILGDSNKLAYFKPIIISLAETCLNEAIGEHGQVCDEYEIASQKRHEESYWWVQAEALVGFLNVYYLTGEARYIKACNDIWVFINNHHIDAKAGEWHWLSNMDNNQGSCIYKAGFWKAPYHNGRAMMEVAKLFDLIKGE
ncbi:AGE family epimerase/isomerase [Psychrosphaera sp. 1_MG-2023]|uniref:AGE family epimerase/isomerase n=1 Tax=Psychrosphaera sp. 1_MG-2023 TaxID=3062643 RepID=UPI0026E3DF3D|nr:AGE family epimerase/isomerase [Psychrosphaera sp. 1_MG-2023]MDO6717796.1 AGE family epimerase/isomerase [Psychrosphaera sp. 1_MG-2023]